MVVYKIGEGLDLSRGLSYNFDFEGNPEKVPELHVCAIVSCSPLRNLFLADLSFFIETSGCLKNPQSPDPCLFLLHFNNSLSIIRVG